MTMMTKYLGRLCDVNIYTNVEDGNTKEQLAVVEAHLRMCIPTSTHTMIDKSLHDKLCNWGIIKTHGIHDHNHGDSDYAKFVQTAWTIDAEYNLSAIEMSLLKRLLRTKVDRLLDLKKMKHELDELIRRQECADPNQISLIPEDTQKLCKQCDSPMYRSGGGAIVAWICPKCQHKGD